MMDIVTFRRHILTKKWNNDELIRVNSCRGLRVYALVAKNIKQLSLDAKPKYIYIKSCQMDWSKIKEAYKTINMYYHNAYPKLTGGVKHMIQIYPELIFVKKSEYEECYLNLFWMIRGVFPELDPEWYPRLIVTK